MPTIQPSAGQWGQLQEWAAFVQKLIDALPGQEFASRGVSLHSCGSTRQTYLCSAGWEHIQLLLLGINVSG